MARGMGGPIRLSRRLQAVAAMAPRCGCVADVGCDHGYISISLVQRGIADRAIAMDVRTGPLRRAQGHIREQQLAPYIETRLSDGLHALAPGEADVIVMAGMGGATMQGILARGRDVLQHDVRLALQPQSELCEFRSYLADQGFEILAEDFVAEGGKYYPMMLARPQGWEGRQWTQEELDYGPLLLRDRHPVLMQYLSWLQRQFEKILEAIRENGSPEAAQARAEELKGELARIERILDKNERSI